MDFETILFDVDGHVATITLNRPERLNATNDTSRNELGEAWGHRPRRPRDPRRDHHRRRRPRVLGRAGHPRHVGERDPEQGARVAAPPRRVEARDLRDQRHGRGRRAASGRRRRPHHRGRARRAPRHALRGRQRLCDGAGCTAAAHAAVDGDAARPAHEERAHLRAARGTRSGS